MRHDAGSIIRPEPLAYFLTWTTYGSWLPGDPRGWVDTCGVLREPNARLARAARRLLRRPVVVFDGGQRRLVDQAIQEHCAFRDWILHAVQCRTTHAHVVVSALQAPDAVLQLLKARCSRRLSEETGRDGPWWTKSGRVRQLYDMQAMENVVTYVAECQDRR